MADQERKFIIFADAIVLGQGLLAAVDVDSDLQTSADMCAMVDTNIHGPILKPVLKLLSPRLPVASLHCARQAEP